MKRPHLALTTLAATAALALAACAPLPRAVPGDAQVQLPAQWNATSPAQTPSTKAADTADTAAPIAPDWWTALGDAQLNTLVDQALVHNNDLLTALARVQEARATLAAAGAALAPTLSATTAAQAGHSLTVLGPSDSRSVQPGLQASWELDLWGRLSDQQKAADQRLQASAADRDAVRLSVAAATVQAYTGLRALQDQLAISQSTVTSRQQALELAQDQARVGYISQLQLTQAQAELQSVLQQVQQLQWALHKQGTALQLLLGQAGGATPPAQPDGQGLAALQLPPVPASLPSQLLTRRPDIQRAQHLLLAADHSLAAQRAAFLPQVQLSANLGRLLVNALDYNPMTVWSLGGSLLAPLFDGGRREAALNGATAQRDQAAYAYRGAVLAAFADVENALSGTQLLATQMQQAQQRRDTLRQSLGYAHDRYQAGYASYLEELDAQRNLFQAELDVVKLRQQELDNRVQLYKALGGGWTPEAAEASAQAAAQSKP